MSFSIKFNKATKAEADAELALPNYADVPDDLKAYIRAGINALTDESVADKNIAVSAYGHLHTGELGNSTTTSATINVEPVARTAAVVEEPKSDPQPAVDNGAVAD